MQFDWPGLIGIIKTARWICTLGVEDKLLPLCFLVMLDEIPRAHMRSENDSPGGDNPKRVKVNLIIHDWFWPST